MNKLLDLENVIGQHRQRENSKLKVFEMILDHCHSQIQRYNKELHLRECYFTVPIYMLGYPPYEYRVLLNYLIYHLTDNGLFITFSHPNQLYISWKDEDIDVDKYEARRDRIKNTPPWLSSINSSNNRNSINRSSSIINSSSNSSGSRLLDTAPINMDKYKQAKRLQREREREFRLHLQKDVPQKSFQEFLRSGQLN